MKAPHLALLVIALIFVYAFVSDKPYIPPVKEKTVTISYWEKWTGFEGEAMRATVELFNSKKIKNKNGDIIYCKYLTTTQVDRKSLLAIAGGNPPELAGFWSFNTHLFADMNALMPLDDFIARDKMDMDKYIDVYRNHCMYKRSGDERAMTWCLPTTPATVALHWNKEMFEKAGLDPERPPRTFAELEEFAEKLTRRDDKGSAVQMGFLPVEPGWWSWSWCHWFGGHLNEGLEKLTATHPKNIEAFERMAAFAKRYGGGQRLLEFKQGFGSFDSPQNAFMSGKVAMVVQGVWMANFIRFHNPHMKWGCGPFPANFDTGDQPVTIAEMDVITIPRGCKHPDEAWEVIKFINSQEGMEYLCGKALNTVTGEMNSGGQGKLTPFKETTPGWIENHTHPYLRVFIDLAKSKNATGTPKLAVWDEYRAELSAAFDRVWLGKQTSAQALQQVQDRMQDKLDRILRQRKLRAGEVEKN